MNVLSRDFTPNEAAYLANACLAVTAEERVGADLSVAIDCGAMIASARLVAKAGRVVSTGNVNKAIEEKIFKVKRKKVNLSRRYVSEAAVLYLASSKLLTASLSKEMKAGIYKALSDWMKTLNDNGRVDSPVIMFSKHMVFNLNEDFDRWSTLVRLYARSKLEHIAVNPEIMGGLPVIKGTRVPVYTVLSMVDGGDSVADICEDYPYLSKSAIEAAVIYARAHPKTGRPKRFR